jgi:hypothetical protein
MARTAIYYSICAGGCLSRPPVEMMPISAGDCLSRPPAQMHQCWRPVSCQPPAQLCWRWPKPTASDVKWDAPA